jgi:hypothetical protein
MALLEGAAEVEEVRILGEQGAVEVEAPQVMLEVSGAGGNLFNGRRGGVELDHRRNSPFVISVPKA